LFFLCIDKRQTMRRNQVVDESEAIDKLMQLALSPLDIGEARRILEMYGWDVEKASQSLMMMSSIASPEGGLYDSGIEREFRQDQLDAIQYGPSSGGATGHGDGLVTLTFNRTGADAGGGPVVIPAVPTHVLTTEVLRVLGEDGKPYDAISANWAVASGLPVTDIILYPHNAPEGLNEVAHKYAEGACSLNGVVSFDRVDRGMYDVRAYNRSNLKKPLATNTEPICVGPVAILKTTIQDGNALRISVSTQVPGSNQTDEIQVKPRDWIGLFRADEKDNTVYITYKYCSELVDSSLELRLPYCSDRFQVRYIDNDSPHGVCSGMSDVIDYIPLNKMEVLSYNSAEGKLRVQWSCFSRQPSSYFWIGLFSDSKNKEKAQRETWQWCSKGQVGANSGHGLLDLELPKKLAETVCSSRGWEYKDFELRFYASNTEFLFSCPLPFKPQEPSASSISPR